LQRHQHRKGGGCAHGKNIRTKAAAPVMLTPAAITDTGLHASRDLAYDNISEESIAELQMVDGRNLPAMGTGSTEANGTQICGGCLTSLPHQQQVAFPQNFAPRRMSSPQVVDNVLKDHGAIDKELYNRARGATRVTRADSCASGIYGHGEHI
jgi:hypothetical protein